MEKQNIEICADLAYIGLTDAEKLKFSKAVDQIIDYFAVLDEIVLEKSESTYEKESSPLRPDIVKPSDLSEEILAGAAETEDRFITIPNVL